MTAEHKYQDTIDWLYRRGKYEYGTPEYWIKERKSKFRVNARQKDEERRKFYENVVNLWALQPMIEMPLYSMLTGKNKYTTTWDSKWTWVTPINTTDD